MNTVPIRVQSMPTMAFSGNSDTYYLKKLPWSLTFAVVPFIPEILETIRTLISQMAQNRNALYVKHGKTELYFTSSRVIDFYGGNSDDQNY